MVRLLDFLGYLVHLYEYVVIAGVIMSWLIGFNVINAYNPTVRTIWNAVNALTEPFLRPIRGWLRRILPDLGGIDISPVILLIACFGVRSVIIDNLKDLFR